MSQEPAEDFRQFAREGRPNGLAGCARVRVENLGETERSERVSVADLSVLGRASALEVARG